MDEQSLILPKAVSIPDISAIQGAAKSVAPTPPQSQQLDYQAAMQAGYTPVQIKNFLEQNNGIQTDAPSGWDQNLQQDTILPPSRITENFGQSQPGVEVFSHGQTLGTGFGVGAGTPVALPPGKWKVIDAFNKAKYAGIGDNENSGYGNSVLAQNADTGETLRFSHLADVHVQPGDEIGGRYIIGKTGDSGNTTGPHLNLEYYDPNGNLGDVMQSNYAQYLPTQQ